MNQHSRDDLTEKYLYTLLDVVNKNGSIKRLTREGINYMDIARLTDIAIAEKLLEVKNNKKLVVTVAGAQFLQQKKGTYTNYDKEAWIEPAKKSRIAKLDKNAIFVPSQNELTFKRK